MTDRRARLVALSMFFVSWTCVGLNWRTAFGGSTPLFRIAGGLALAINGASVVMNALSYLMHCPGVGFDPHRHRWEERSLDTAARRAGDRRQEGDLKRKRYPRQ